MRFSVNLGVAHKSNALRPDASPRCRQRDATLDDQGVWTCLRGGAGMQEANVKSYRIGEFARKVGVSPDFLKYQEELGTVADVDKTSSGYRYYWFGQTSRIYEILRYKNLGFTRREIPSLIGGMGIEETARAVERRRDELRGQVDHKLELLAAMDAIVRDSRRFARAPYWLVTECEPFDVLPHSRRDSFLEYPGLEEHVRRWTRLLPATQRALVMPRDGDYVWGLGAERPFVDRHRELQSERLVHMPAGRHLECYLRLPLDHQELIAAGPRIPQAVGNIMSRHGLRAAGDTYAVLHAFVREGDADVALFKTRTPVEE